MVSSSRLGKPGSALLALLTEAHESLRRAAGSIEADDKETALDDVLAGRLLVATALLALQQANVFG